jgi:hypothetical protein
MIDSVERIEIVKSQDLPTHFRMMIGNRVLSFTRYPYSDYTNRVYFHHDGSNEEIYFQHNEPVAILVEDSLDNPVTYAEVMLELL